MTPKPRNRARPNPRSGEGRGDAYRQLAGSQVRSPTTWQMTRCFRRKLARWLWEFCGNLRCFVVLSRAKCNGCHASSSLMTLIKSTIYGLRKFPINCTFEHLLQLRTRGSGVRISPGAPSFFFEIKTLVQSDC